MKHQEKYLLRRINNLHSGLNSGGDAEKIYKLLPIYNAVLDDCRHNLGYTSQDLKSLIANEQCPDKRELLIKLSEVI